MRRNSWLAKSAVAICSFGLIGIYVYNQAGGDVLPWQKRRAEKQRAPTSIAPPFVARPASENEAASFLPGSKAPIGPIVEYREPAPYPQEVQPPTKSEALRRTGRLMPGSKSAPILSNDRYETPAYGEPVSEPAVLQEAPPSANPTPPKRARMMLPGSKSAPRPIDIDLGNYPTANAPPTRYLPQQQAPSKPISRTNAQQSARQQQRADKPSATRQTWDPYDRSTSNKPAQR